MAEKTGTKIKMLAKKLGLNDDALSFALLYALTQDLVFSFTCTYGHKSKSKNFASVARVKIKDEKIQTFLREIGNTIAFKSAEYFNSRGTVNQDIKELNKILDIMLTKGKDNAISLDKISNIVNYSIDHNQNVCHVDSDKMAVGESELSNDLEILKDEIELTPNMNKGEYLLYLIQEQGKAANQKDKNAFTLKISDYMAFKLDKNDQQRPLIYMPNRNQKSYLERLSSCAKGSISN